MDKNDVGNRAEYLAAIKAEYSDPNKADKILRDFGPLMQFQDAEVLKRQVFVKMSLGAVSELKDGAERLAKLTEEYVQEYLKK